MKGTSPKLRVKDANGVEWKLKMGAEPQAETAATRLLFAAGYFVDEDYYATEVRVEDLPKLKRGENYVKDGTIHSVRLGKENQRPKRFGQLGLVQKSFRRYSRIQRSSSHDVIAE